MTNETHSQDDQPSLLLVDDDETFCRVLKKALTRRGFEVSVAHDVDAALIMVEKNAPEFAVVDLKMPGSSGLVLVKRLKELDEETRIVMLTGFASIATAVEAIKLGATHYLAKPADADQIIAAFEREGGDEETPVTPQPLSVDRLEWEHIQRVLAEHQGNISATARALKMHRRTLQRKLSKHPVRE
ncbi:MAG: response regulator transcription factor [Sulfuricella denitrificans]|nr:response regulator transcription factor [Sulfuricella denitrificans]